MGSRDLPRILYIENERVAATVYRCDVAGLGQAVEIGGPPARLQPRTIDLDIPPGAVYRGVLALGG